MWVEPSIKVIPDSFIFGVMVPVYCLQVHRGLGVRLEVPDIDIRWTHDPSVFVRRLKCLHFGHLRK